MPAAADLTLTATWTPKVYTFKAGDKLTTNSDKNYLLVKADGKLEFHLGVLDDSYQQVDTVIATYNCVIDGSKVTMTDASDATKVFEGVNLRRLYYDYSAQQYRL